MSKTVNLSTYYYNKNDIDTKLAEYYKKTEIDTKLSNKSKVSFTPKKTSGIEIGTINIDGTDTKIYQQDNNTTYTAESTASNIKMNGTQSAGSSTTYARGDHVHPTDTSRAASSHTHGNLQNNGKVGTSNNASKNVVTDSNGTLTTEDKPTIPTASSTASDIKVNGIQSAGTSSNFAKADHVHPTDTSRAASNHVHGNINNNGTITNAAYKNVVTDADGKITTEAKPTIPTKTSDLTNDSGFITSVSGKADKTGGVAQVTDANSNNYTNIGSMSSGATQQTINDNINTKFGNAIYKSTTNGYIKNDGTVGTPTDTKYTAESTATNIKMNGTQSAGSLSTYARGDHVHPTDSSRAPTAHAVNATTYGLSTTGVYGHTKLVENLTTNAGNGLALGAGQGKALKTMIDNIISGETATDHNHDGSYIKTGTGTVTSTNIADGTIVNGDIANTTIQGGKLVNGTITATQLASNAVETVKIKDSAVTNAKLADQTNTVTEYIVGTQTASTSAWTGKATKISSLAAGQVIYYKLPYASTSTAVTLNLTLADGTTTTGAKEVWFWNGNRVTTHYGVDSVVGLVYNGTQWWVINPSNNNNNNYLNSADYYTTGEAVTSQNLIACKKEDNKYYKINTLKSTVINIARPILLANGSINANTNTNTSIIYNPWVNPTNLNGGTSLTLSSTIYQPVYLEGTSYSNGDFTVSTTPITQTLTSGRFYILLGIAYNTNGLGVDLTNQQVLYYNGTTLMPSVSWTGLTNKPSSFTPSSHTHGNITNAGAIGSTANLPIITDTNGVLKTGSFGTAANTFCQGNDSRLSNARTPTSHATTATTYGGGTSNNYGHVKVSDNYTSSAGNASQSVAASSAAVKAIYDIANPLKERYNGNFISGVSTVTKPYLRLFHIASSNGSSSSSHLIFEIIGNNNDRLYAKIRVDMRQNNVGANGSASSYTVTPLEVYGFNLNELYFGFYDNHVNSQTCLDIYRKVGAYVNFYIRIADDHLRNGSYTMFTPVANGTESYTDLNEASTSLYNANYTSTSQGGTYTEVTNTIPYTNVNANKFVKRDGTSSQFLKADGSVDSTTYVATGDSRLSNARTPTAHTDSNGAYGKATTSVWGHTKLNSATNSTDETTAATPKAVKAAYDLANGKPSLGTTSTTAAKGDHTHDYSSTYAPKTHTHASSDVTGLTASKNVVTGSDGKLTTENKPTIPTGSSTATDIKMNGTQSAGSSSNFAKADHVHPVDTSRVAVAQGSGNANKTLSTDGNGNVTVENKNNHSHYDNQISYSASLAGAVTPIDLAAYEEFNANRLAFLPPANITIKYSTTGVTGTWTDYGASNADKTKLVSLNDTSKYPSFLAGKNATASTNNALQIILDAGYNTTNGSNVYVAAKKMFIYFSTGGATGCKCQIDVAYYNAQTTFTQLGTWNMSGYSGWNSIPFNKNFGGMSSQMSSADRVRYIRLTFWNTTGNYNFAVKAIKMIGENAWIFPSNLSVSNHMYTYDENQNVTFPAKIIKSGGTSSQLLLANGDTKATGDFATSGHTHTKSQITDFPTSMTPTAHTDSNGAYGKATTSVWGHTKLNSATNSTDETTAATPKAVKAAYDLANGKPSLGTTSTTAAKGDHTHDYSKVSVSPTKTSGVEIGRITVDGTEKILYQQDNNTTYSAVTQSANGLMTSADKQKLDKSMAISAGNAGGTTSAFTATLTGVTLTHGTLIALYNNVGNNAANATLKINNLSAKPIVYQSRGIRAYEFPRETTAIFMYNTTLMSTGCWQMIYSLNSTYDAGLGLKLDETQTFSADFGTGKNQIARGNHTHTMNNITDWLNKVYPIGSIYMNIDSTKDPNSLIGGIWVQISQGRMLLGAGTAPEDNTKTYTAGDTDGSKDAVVVSHHHNAANNTQFISGNDGSIGRTSKRAFVPENSGGIRYLYDTGTSITDSCCTTDQGVDGTDMNMPPYLVVYMWKRTA